MKTLPKFLFVFFACFTFLLPTSSFAQQSSFAADWQAYYTVDLAYFFDHPPAETPSQLYRAIQFDHRGQTDSAIIILQNILLDSTVQADQRPQVAQYLYQKYKENHQYAAALWLDHAEALEQQEDSKLRFYQNLPHPTVKGTGVSAIPFDQYYLEAMIGNEPIKIFLDTGAPGLTIDAKWARKNNWPTDKKSSGKIVEPYIGIEYATYPTLVQNLSIGDFELNNIPAQAVELSEEQWKKKTQSGIEKYDIIMGLDAFYGLLEGVELDYAVKQFRLYKTLPNSEGLPNFQRVEGKPAISFYLAEERFPAFLDSGSPRHVFTRPMIAAADTISSFTDNFGSYEYQVFTLKMDQLVNLENITLEAANYARRTGGAFDVSAHFGSFPGYSVLYNLKSRRVSITPGEEK